MAKLEDIVSLCKRRGFIFQGSDVYGGMSGTWDFGPLGVALKRKIMQTWWKYWVDILQLSPIHQSNVMNVMGASVRISWLKPPKVTIFRPILRGMN